MNRLTRLAAVALMTVAPAACAPMTVSSHVEYGLDVTRYHSFEWGPADALPTGDPRLDRNPFFKDHFEGAVEKQLILRGLEHADANPDLLIHYHISINRRIDVNRTDTTFGYCTNGDCNTPIVEFEAGTMVLDIMDARTNRLLWRGWAQHSIGDELENQDHLARRINEAVKRMLARFTPL